MNLETSRRGFLASAAATGALAAGASAADSAANTGVLRVGLIGCGGRGTGAASQALRADKNVKLVALGDVFEDKLQKSLATLQRDSDIAGKIDVPADRQFVGFDAYQKVIACCDVVLLTTSPHFRPMHFKAAVDAGKHVFAEKPVAVDAPGVRSVLATCEEAKRKKLSVVSGLCLRYDAGFRETVKRIHEGAVGRVVTMFANDYRSGRPSRSRLPEWTDMQYQMRNWYNFTWLSGDFNVEQHVHYLDVCAWVMKNEYPVKAIGMGGRQVLTDAQFGHIYDHFSITYEYADGTRFVSNTRQQKGCANDMSAQVLGSKGTVNLSERDRGLSIRTGDSDWVFNGPGNAMYQVEHDELFASIRSGAALNNGEYMAKSTLLAIMGRMAAYTGKVITWEMAMNSKEDLSPKAYDWNAPLAHPAVAMPGVTKFA